MTETSEPFTINLNWGLSLGNHGHRLDGVGTECRFLDLAWLMRQPRLSSSAFTTDSLPELPPCLAAWRP